MRYRGISFIFLVMIVGACAPKNPYTKSYVSDKVKAQSQFDLIKEKQAGKFDIPPGVELKDGVTEDEAVSVAMWNNAQFQADLVGISFAQADVIDAGIIQNPLIRYLSPNAGIVAQGYIYFYLDAIWQRPRRVAAARGDAKKVAENLVQRTFTLIRDVQVAYADLSLAKTRVNVLSQNAQIRNQMSQLANSRLLNGDISELEATTARVDSVNATDILLRAAQDTSILRYRFNALLGIASQDTVIALQPTPAPNFSPIAKTEVLELAYTYQPEIIASLAAIEAAGKRIGWERSRILVFTAVLNGQNFAGTPSALDKLPGYYQPGFQTELPIFNRNEGKIARAKAELEQASLNYIALRQRIALDVSEAYARYELAYKSYQLWNSNVLPPLERAVYLSQDSYGTGDVSYLPVLEATRQMLDARLRKAEVEAELRRSVSQLNFRIGKQVLNQ